VEPNACTMRQKGRGKGTTGREISYELQVRGGPSSVEIRSRVKWMGEGTRKTVHGDHPGGGKKHEEVWKPGGILV